jgi:hypothetical protein
MVVLAVKESVRLVPLVEESGIYTAVLGPGAEVEAV